MPSLTIDGTVYELPVDDTVAQKVLFYNAVLGTALNAAWTSWVPTWTNLSVGNGTVVAKYRQIGKLVVCRLSLVFGSSTSISGSVSLSLPVTGATYGGTAAVMPLGNLSMFDTSANAVIASQLAFPTTTTAGLRAVDTSGAYAMRVNVSSTVPFTWATGDEIHTQFYYEVA